ncbi:hypothetical protein PoB_001509200 [Plakobranchus ocellatus]|uniref:Uncharacterized protein n=1 Tax=Plakobranchus ocellatus TaxID=259542 RepID=A0AAV3Z230_9GAST|nr:hypothetical protein PoB_001509200 [Plakobranchus ocellatus]
MSTACQLVSHPVCKVVYSLNVMSSFLIYFYPQRFIFIELSCLFICANPMSELSVIQCRNLAVILCLKLLIIQFRKLIVILCRTAHTQMSETARNPMSELPQFKVGNGRMNIRN